MAVRRAKIDPQIMKADRPVIGYTRVSTGKQADEGVSLAMQRQKIAAYCELHGLELTETLEDAGESGKTMERPAMCELLARVRSGAIGAVVTYKLDRLTRRTRDLLALVEDELKPRNVALVSLSESIDTGTSAGVMMLTMIGALAQMERELIAERTRAALAHKKERGDRLGTTPLGFTTPEPGGKMEPVATELEPVRLILSRRAAGESYRTIAGALTAGGYATKRGGKWEPATVRLVWERRDRYAAVA